MIQRCGGDPYRWTENCGEIIFVRAWSGRADGFAIHAAGR
jgi:hypothetical protein